MSDYLFSTEQDNWRPHPRFEGASVCPLITTTENAGLTISRVRLEPGAGLPLHTHEHSTETFLIMKGQAYCRVGDQEMKLCAGDMGYAPPGVFHQVRNQGDQVLEALSIFNPPLG